MAIVVKDRIKETFTGTGTADFTLGGAVTGYQAFSAVGNGSVTYYAAVDVAAGTWEVGTGTYSTTGPTLTRTTVLESSSAGAKVSFGAGSKEVFCTYPAEKAIYEEPAGNTIFDGGPITVVGSGVTSYTSFTNYFAEMFGNANTYVQSYVQNQNSGSEASADFVALNNLGTDATYYVDMGMNSSGYTSASYPIYTANSGYVYSIGGANKSKMFVGSADDDLILHAGGFATTNVALTVSGTTQAVAIAKNATIAGTAGITGAATFGSTVLLSADPSLALQAATKQYVDTQVTAGLHIHEPVLVETTANLTATYTQGGTTFNITDITGNKTLTTSVNHGLSLYDQIWLYTTAGNGLSINTAYFVASLPALNQITVSLVYGGAEITTLTNATGLAYNTRANSGVGAKLTNSGTQLALSIDNVALALTNRVMVRLQTLTQYNGVYTVTNIGSGATNWELTRSTDANKVAPADPLGLGTGDYFYTQDGDLNTGDSHVLTTEPNTMIIGYTGLTYTQFSGAVTYTGTAPINVTGQTIALTGTVAATNGGTGTSTVTTGNLLYGSATNTWGKLALGAAYRPLVVNAAGTQLEWNALALNQTNAVSGSLGATNGGTGLNSYTLGDILYSSAANTLIQLAGNTTTTKKFLGQTGSGAASAAPSWQQPAATDITGLATSATTDTTNAANISSGTLPTGRISGSYTGLTGTGALAAGSLATGFTAVAATLGGTGQTSYAVGDILYASTTTALSKLADVAVGNALISGGVGSAPSWGKVGLATHVSGTLPVLNGGTGVTSSTGTGNTVLSDSPTLVSPALGTPSALVGTNISGTAASLSIGGSADTFTSTSQNSQFNSIGVGAAASAVAGRINSTTAIITPGVTGVSTGLTVVNGDITTYRTGGTTGVVYLTNSGTRYLFFDGTSYQLNGAAVVATNITAAGNVTGTAVALSTAGGSAPSYAARAWANMNGVTNTVVAGGNVSTVGDGVVGIVNVNFATALPNANYCPVLGYGQTIGGGSYKFCVNITALQTGSPTSKTTGTLQVVCGGTAGIDFANLYIAVFS